MESLGSWKSKAEMVERQAELLEKLLIASKAQEARFKEELLACRNSIQGLEAQPWKKEEELRSIEQEATDLDIRLADAVSKGLFWESRGQFGQFETRRRA